jgi:hypothetical protein
MEVSRETYAYRVNKRNERRYIIEVLLTEYVHRVVQYLEVTSNATPGPRSACLRVYQISN